jgi:hypothetical protein
MIEPMGMSLTGRHGAVPFNFAAVAHFLSRQC